MEPSVPNLLRGRRVRRARVLHPLRTARNRPRATRCSFAPRGNDRGRGSRETRKRVKKEGSKVVSPQRRRRARLFLLAGRRETSVQRQREPANRRRCGFFFFLSSFFALRAPSLFCRVYCITTDLGAQPRRRSAGASETLARARHRPRDASPRISSRPPTARRFAPYFYNEKRKTKNEKRKTTNACHASSRRVFLRFAS